MDLGALALCSGNRIKMGKLHAADTHGISLANIDVHSRDKPIQGVLPSPCRFITTTGSAQVKCVGAVRGVGGWRCAIRIAGVVLTRLKHVNPHG